MYYDSYQPERQTPSGSWQPEPVPPRKKKRFWPKAVALVLCCTLAGGGAGAGGAALYHHLSGGGSATTFYSSDRVPTVVNISHTSTGQQLSLEEIYASWVNSTVGITTQITTNVYGQQVSHAAAGSGFVLSADGYILTNYHVIQNASAIKVTFYDGTEYDAKLVGGEEVNDIAVLKIEASGLTPVIIGSSDNLHVGETVTAIGNPLGELTFSQTSGIVSALDRMITMSDGTKMNMIQTNCTINSGNSGGPLFNTYGEVVGITSAKYSNNGSTSEAAIEGIGFAIPMDDVVDLVKDIIEQGYVVRPYMGISVTTMDESDAQRYNLTPGVYVNNVEAAGPAAAAGLQQGDVITAMNGVQVLEQGDLIALRNTYRVGDTVELTVYRMGQVLTLSLTFSEAPPDDGSTADQSQQQPQQPQSPSNDYYYDWPFSGWPFNGYGW